ncbi:MAG: UDP-N-acetylmuramoylalanyl-D-glutamyl-2, 6-diaminopimelate--D-alanyl-D-alanine ligase, partial [Rhodospirillaceae bacterium]|nr:UDP-N-acetylmuramoylalanyl-D-glutamyl-2, 6-diaminopimelate--D-alanyl-D-alanine ligase [Rhodospirillaceae bacterium]
DLIQPLFDEIKPGDVVLVKGSAGSQMGKIVDALLELLASPQINSEDRHAL